MHKTEVESHLSAEALATVTIPSLLELPCALQVFGGELTFEQVTSAIESRPLVVAAAIAQANRAQYGCSGKIWRLIDAANLIRNDGLLKKEIASRTDNTQTGSLFGIGDGVDQYAFTAAKFAQHLAGSVGLERDAAWLAALLLRLGSYPIQKSDESNVVQSTISETMSVSRWRRQVEDCGLSEGGVIAVLAEKANFPTSVVNALRYSAFPMQADTPFYELAGIVHIAAIMADLKELDAKDESIVLQSIPTSVVYALDLNVSAILDAYFAWPENNELGKACITLGSTNDADKLTW